MTIEPRHTPPSSAECRSLPGGGLEIGAGIALATLATHALVRERYPALAQACDVRGAESTLAVDLAQRGQCRYLQQGAPCLKNGGPTCLAIDGDNRLLAIVEGGPSWIIHPSEAGVALVALDAVLRVEGLHGVREVAAADFWVLPTQRLDAETVLASDERVVAVVLPGESAGGLQRYRAVRDDDTHEVLVSVAATRRTDGEVRLVLGRVAPRPYRIYNSIEEETTSGGLDADTIEGLADRALLDAEPLSQNAYKLDLAASLLRDAIRELAAEGA